MAFHWKQLKERSWKNKLPYLFSKTDTMLVDVPQILSSTRTSEWHAHAAARRRVVNIQPKVTGEQFTDIPRGRTKVE
jgi:hypothetical protein